MSPRGPGREPQAYRAAPYPVPRHLEGTQACAGEDPEMFFPPPGNATTPVDAAKAICHTCPFEHGCAAYAVARPDLWGVWGATTYQERQHIRRRGRRTA